MCKIELLRALKDFAFNNMMIVMASDGVFADDEKKITAEFAKKWGFRVDDIKPLFNMAMTGRLGYTNA